MNFKTWAAQQETIIFDTSMSLGLENLGFDTNNPLWTAKALITDPDKIYQVHLDFFNAGSNITTTDSYQASPAGFEKQGYSYEESEKFIKESVLLAQRARLASTGKQTKWVAGNIGPYGAYLANGAEYTGNYDTDQAGLKLFHQDRMKWLIEAGSDLLAIQTVPSLLEVKTLCNLLDQYPNMSVLFTCSLKDSHHIADGTDLVVVQQLLENQDNIVAYGLNCFNPEFSLEAISYLREHAKKSKAIALAPNAGSTYDPNTKTWTVTNESVFSENACAWHDAGASWISGCCQMIPDELARVKAELEK
ncbi:homocysteine S-methyltransferase [Convivina intestini]|uniref:Homocysteine S-methyltransferase n=1 Tax=Convivina intestini TaxID=1505726 RepID=A0A2U1D9H5_9LACO|nr:homocysteine S-methyltransferase [Convivina intestini]PVY84336.1 homocysteine S-methyltransferase [Convivina intestini]CAH1857006.1 Homocysteine S-methyltransferase [Convivina intestini]SDC06234.1 homocysteine S-methyltransferase [Leuconostocaceae bacterium R-53105]